MELKELTTKLNDLVVEGNSKMAFELLKKELDVKSSRIVTFRLLQTRYNRYKDAEMGKIIGTYEADTRINGINKDLFTFIESVKQSDLGSETIYTHRLITNHILIFTKEELVQSIRDFFLQLNFVNVDVKNYSNVDYELEDFDLVIFDNQDIPFCNKPAMLETFDGKAQTLIKERIKKMESVLEASSTFMIHFGEFLFWVSSNRNRVQAANSKFSLHARTKEVIDFINTYRV